MPLPALLGIPAAKWGPVAVSGISQILGGLIGGGKQTKSYQMSPQQEQLWNMVMGQMRGPTPGYIVDPIKSRYAGIRENIREGTTQALGPLSGLQTAQLIKASGAQNVEMGHARRSYMDQLRNLLASIMPKGSETISGTTDWGGVVRGIGGDVLEQMGFEAAVGSGKPAAGAGGNRNRWGW